jgi:hypothetical protein
LPLPDLKILLDDVCWAGASEFEEAEKLVREVGPRGAENLLENQFDENYFEEREMEEVKENVSVNVRRTESVMTPQVEDCGSIFDRVMNEKMNPPPHPV